MAMRTSSTRLTRAGLAAALLCALAASQPFAQKPQEGVAELKDVTGNVLVSRESGLASGSEALRLTQGTRVITTANSEVTVHYDDGCDVHLKENQRFEVETGKPCGALVAMAQSILLEPAGAALASTAGGLAAYAATLPALGGGLVGLGILQSAREKTPVSPS
jgi:hypothetical protein